jgi:eukaryotic-like serine/threonine-protein kinase
MILARRLFRIGILILIFGCVAAVSTYITLTFFIKRADKVVVPDLLGQHIVAALETLSELSLNARISSSEYSNDVPSHHVIFQDPSPGEELKKGRDIRLTLSRGVLNLSAPSLVGLPLTQAKIVIKENGLLEGTIAYDYSPDVKPDMIIAQSPENGSKINRGGLVSILVSKGVKPREFIMPNLYQMTPEDIILVLDDMNLRLGPITTTHSKTDPLNVVIDQKPRAGHRIEEGGMVHIVINRSPDKLASSSNKVLQFEFFRYRLEPGYLKRHIKLRLNAFGATLDLYDDFMKPGEEIAFFIPKDDNSSVLLFRDEELILTRTFND